MRKLRGFCTAFAVTMCVLGLGVGLFTVGYNSRKLAHGEGAEGGYCMQNGRLLLTDQNGNQLTVQVVEEQKVTAPLLPAPARLTLHILRGVAAAADALAKKLDTLSL